ncbi:hypothetical protein TVAG_124320 [Trichomonas vaginalis G3]|uniref:Uncharacterized protein n=1 Tax=Trichomonas vaginalis (strain ATCC PRA-98 / G3) TaxID=412133 RepID=A2FYQ6_TRIV3|nr:hypothetical protein TVAGG3_0597130 [Trichomonas vaginalis G3]EAX89952.1 hypothetical protein TVAG_124320 [Trichomonas vaginalis G3]KAI5523675.1 hypothetical protein TVAGG3_0597130 [Trichomonas vaginalis G3]|eukprot:XP_001302882.1 hypothetical protein [Trichomonas vaginalis G3]
MADGNDPSLVTTASLKGRETPIEGVQTKRASKVLIETPSMPFETESYKFRQTATKSQQQTSPSRRAPQTSSGKRIKEGLYSVKMKNSTWTHTDPDVPDHYASRKEILEVLNNFESAVKSLTGVDDTKTASAMQNITDLLLEQLACMLRAECREQELIVEKSRESYAEVFLLLRKEINKSHDEMDKLKNHNVQLEAELTKVIDTSSERVNEIQFDCERQLKAKDDEMEQRKQEYDLSMKRFLEQKSQLEEHVKALHRVFLDFQSDSVYITLEDLKQKLANTEKKLRYKETEIQKLNDKIDKHKKQILDLQAQKTNLDQANGELRRKLQNALASKGRLERQIEIQQFGEEEDGEKKGKRNLSVDSTPYISVLQKLNQIYDKISDILQRSNVNVPSQQQYTDDIDKVLLSGNPALMIQAVEKRVIDVLQTTENLDSVDIHADNDFIYDSIQNPRFLQYVAPHIDVPLPNTQSSDYNPFQIMRQIFQAKYLQDEWMKRTGGQVQRFPEFIVSFFTRNDESLFVALTNAARLWRCISDEKYSEMKLFKSFALEEYTCDELTFFLRCRYLLLGLPGIDSQAPKKIMVDISEIKNMMNSVVGQYSHVAQSVIEKAEKQANNENRIDYAEFMIIFLEFYERERRKRRNAVRLMFQSKQYMQGNIKIDFENFCALVKSLGYQGDSQTVFELYREATMVSKGDLNLESLLTAMDSMGFHFYSIEAPITLLHNTPVTELKRSDLFKRWIRFGRWFEGFLKPLGTFDTWLHAELKQAVKRVDNIFKTNSPVPVMFNEYRKLLDYFQFMLDMLAEGSKNPMTPEKSNRELLLMENLVDLLVTHVVTECDKDYIFEELTS